MSIFTNCDALYVLWSGPWKPSTLGKKYEENDGKRKDRRNRVPGILANGIYRPSCSHIGIYGQPDSIRPTSLSGRLFS